MQTAKHGFAMIHIILGLTEGEIDNVNGIDLPHLVVVVAKVYIVGYHL